MRRQVPGSRCGPELDLFYQVPIPLALRSMLSDEADTADSDLALRQFASEGSDDRTDRLNGGAVGHRDVGSPVCLLGIFRLSHSALSGFPDSGEH